MKLSAENRQVFGQNLGKTTSFTIAETAHSFKILSNALYSDRIRAILRELCCNAIDSHKLAGQTQPYKITLPSPLNPIFSIRDFGVGLSLDQIMSLFTIYFGSSKLETNDQIGGFGLGCKSPFSYTESFTIISIYNGTKTTCNAYIGETGTPQISVFCQEPSTEHNGVEINFPVEKKDFTEFAQKLGKVVTYFDILPEVTGNSYYSPSKVSYISDHGFFKIRESGNYCQIIMGGVAYPVDRDQFNKVKSSLSSDCLRLIAQSPIDIFVEIGKIAINPSRESLNYREKDLAVLVDLFTKIHEIMVSTIKNDITAATNLWQAQLLLLEFYSTQSYEIRSIFNNTNFYYKNTLLSTYIGKGFTFVVPENTYVKVYKSHYKKVAKRYEYVAPSTSEPNDTIISISYSKNAKFFFNDTKNGNQRIISFKENTPFTIYEFGVLDQTKPAPSLQKFSDLVNGAPVELVSTLPKVVKTKSTNKKVYRLSLYEITADDTKTIKSFNTTKHLRNSNGRKDYTADDFAKHITDSPRERFYITVKDPTEYYMEFQPDWKDKYLSIIGALVALKVFPDVEIYLTTQGTAKILFEKNNIPNFSVWYENKYKPSITNFINDQKNKDLINILINVTLDWRLYSDIMDGYTRFSLVNKSPTLDALLTDYENTKKIRNNIGQKVLDVFKQYFPQHIEEVTGKPVTKTNNKSLLNKYPMIRFIEKNNYGSFERVTIQDIVDYINLVDNQNKTNS